MSDLLLEEPVPELVLDELCASAGIRLRTLKPITISGWHITPDRKVVHTDVVIVIDRPYQDAEIQRRETQWRDRQLLSRGFRIFHIPAQLLASDDLRDSHGWWRFVLLALIDFLLSKQKIRRMVVRRMKLRTQSINT